MFITNTNIKQISKERSLRLDLNYQKYNDHSNKNSYKFAELFETIKVTKSDKEKVLTKIIDKDFSYVEIGDVSNNGFFINPKNLNFNKNEVLDSELHKKVQNKLDIQLTKPGDILISKTRPILNKVLFINNVNSQFLYTTAFYNIRPKKENKILYYALKTIFKKHFVAIQRWGKNYPTINIEDLSQLEFDKQTVDQLLADSNEIIKNIEPIENKLAELSSKKITNKEVIENIIHNKLKFDTNYYSKKSNPNQYKASIKNIALNDLRFTTIVYSPTAIYLYDFLKNIETVPLKNILLKLIKGIQPEYRDHGVNVICTGNINEGKVDVVGANEIYIKFVDEDFYKKHIDRSAKKNNLVLSMDGEGRGKFAIHESDLLNIVDSHVAILKINTDIYNPKFLNYFLNSKIGSEQVKLIETHNKGAMAIQELRLEKIRIPSISLEEQDEIVKEVDINLNAQIEISSEIEEQNLNIEKIFESYITKML